MAVYKTLGDRIRRKREAIGLRSAAALAKKAGLSINYVSIVERGERLPRWETAQKLAAALELKGAERDDFFRLVDRVSKPARIREATTFLSIPSLVLWKHLPKLLYAKDLPHVSLPTGAISADDAVYHTLRAAAALLGWVELEINPPAETLRVSLTRALDEKIEALLAIPGSFPEVSRIKSSRPPRAAVTALPLLWREWLFRERPTAARLVRLLARWEYAPRGGLGEWDLLSFQFHDSALHARHSVSQVEPEDIVELYENMVTERLWRLLALDARFNQNPVLPWRKVFAAVTWLDECDPQKKTNEITQLNPNGSVGNWAAYKECVGHLIRVAFASRVFHHPELVVPLFGFEQEINRSGLAAFQKNLFEKYDFLAHVVQTIRRMWGHSAPVPPTPRPVI